MDNINVKKLNFNIEKELDSFLFLVTDNDGKKYLIYHFEEDDTGFSNFKFAMKRLANCGVKTPEVIKMDKKNQRFLVEYVEGENIIDLVIDNKLDEKYIEQLFNMNYKARINQLRLDFEPHNFLIKEGNLYYLPFTFSQYKREEDFTQKEIRLWFYTKEFISYIEKRGYKGDKSRLLPEYEQNKSLVLTVVKYFR